MLHLCRLQALLGVQTASQKPVCCRGPHYVDIASAGPRSFRNRSAAREAGEASLTLELQVSAERASFGDCRQSFGLRPVKLQRSNQHVAFGGQFSAERGCIASAECSFEHMNISANAAIIAQPKSGFRFCGLASIAFIASAGVSAMAHCSALLSLR